MRKLTLDDTFRFCVFVKVAKARPVLAEVLNMAAQANEDRKKELDEKRAAAAAGTAGAEEALKAAEADSSWLYGPGINGVLMLLECAAENGAKDAFYKFLAPVWEDSVDHVKDLTLDAFIRGVQEMFCINDMSAFFGAAQKMGM